MGDTDFIKIPLNGVINKEYAKTLKNKIDETKSQEYTEGDPWKYESNETTHYSIIDKEGNIVAVTFTVNGVFASGVVADGTGILLIMKWMTLILDMTSKFYTRIIKNL